jgi:O-acetylhomoserine (thiol)-lyase
MLLHSTGMETLGLWMQRHCDNALKVANGFRIRKAWVIYAGLPSDAHHALHKNMP